MKGLLIKDFKLIMMQKNFFLVVLAAGVVLTIMSDDASFVLSFITFVGTIFSITTISYDEFDNGYAFLFSLPITRKQYVIEKYVLGIILSLFAWLVGFIIMAIGVIYKGNVLDFDMILSSLIYIAIVLIILTIMLPFQLKFGSDRGRIAIIVAVVLGVIVVNAVVKITQSMNIDLFAQLTRLSTLGTGILAGIGFIIILICLLLSSLISIRVMNNKQF